MSFRKKVTLSTLAVSMAAATLAGVPLSNQGLAKQLGTNEVSAASSNLDTIKNKLERLYAQLSSADKTKLQALRSEINSKIDLVTFESSAASLLEQTSKAGVSNETIYSLFKAVTSLTYDPTYQNLVEIRTTPEYINAAKKIGEAGGVDDLTVDDLANFLFGSQGIESQIVNIVKNKTLVELTDLLNNSEARNKLIRDAYRSVLSTSVGNQSVANVLNKLGITEDMIATTVINVQKKLDPAIVKSAILVLGLAYIRAENIQLPGGPGTTPPPSNGGGDGSTGGGGGSVITPAPSGSLQELLKFNASKLVEIVNGKATLKLNDADMLRLFEAIKVAAANEKGEITLSIDLGTVQASSIDVPISKAIIEAAKSAGIDNMAIAVNGLIFTLPINQFNDSIKLSINKKDDAVISGTSKLKLASDVYEFLFEAGGKQVTSFRKPITIRIPLRDVNVDQELLSVVKDVLGVLQFHGGVLDGKFIVEKRDTLSTYAVVENKVIFKDLRSVQSWAGRQIEVVAAKGAIEGKASGVFAPKDSVTRAEFAKMLIRALNLENSYATESFVDVNDSDWFAPYVAAAVELGIINGRTSTKFAPHEKITRVEMATMIARALKLTQNLTDENNSDSIIKQFVDANQIGESYKQAVAFATDKGLVVGSNGKFNPKKNATRAEAAVMIYRTMNYKK
ncbi:S-layer homology domain-containing protein [Paenibacillus gallinarum]|uniref:S-layer homology domain-containing protein n=1 Tax=Paenibacillus gallinarum TaxID=2762232 RepID=A0ABR8T459_9BACL|nr:S-layer homology domain-containing protein [Paenibacillus gallinarum]MBD7970561.1 S-layer homology domain-containing protein [Paenibacillus gallinarum]